MRKCWEMAGECGESNLWRSGSARETVPSAIYRAGRDLHDGASYQCELTTKKELANLAGKPLVDEAQGPSGTDSGSPCPAKIPSRSSRPATPSPRLWTSWSSSTTVPTTMVTFRHGLGTSMTTPHHLCNIPLTASWHPATLFIRPSVIRPFGPSTPKVTKPPRQPPSSSRRRRRIEGETPTASQPLGRPIDSLGCRGASAGIRHGTGTRIGNTSLDGL
jgi:hypothetical protein